MTSYILGADGGADQKSINTMKTLLEQKGHTVHFTSINREQEAAFTGATEDMGIFVVNGVAAATIWSFKVAIEKGTVPPTIFAHAAWLRKEGAMASEQAMLNCPFTPEHDAGFASGKEGNMQKDADGAKTVGEYAQKYSQYIHLCYADSPEEMVEKIINSQFSEGGNGTPSNTESTSTNGAVKIPDITFYGLIKQIIGATDSIFTISNNMAYLMSFSDMFKYRLEYDNNIPIIDPSDVIIDSIEKEWTTAGYYNNVEVTYADGILEYGHDTLIKQYGKNTFYYDFSNDDYETAKSKAQALLTAHVRDYSTDIQLQIFYNENITAGSWVKLHKSLTKIDGKTRREQKQEEIITKRKGITLSNITEEINQNKKIKHIVDKKGNKFDIESDNTEYDLFFVQGYSCKWNKYNALIMDIQLKYGPDTPEDPTNATIGGLSSGSTNNTSSNESEDIKNFVAQCIGNETDERKKAELVHEALRKIISYEYYECSRYKTPSECMQNASHLNCADTSRLTRACMSAAGLKAQVVHGPGHFWTEIEINGEIIASDLSGNRDLGEVWKGLTKNSDNGDEPEC